MQILGLTPLQEDCVQTYVGITKAFIHKETTEVYDGTKPGVDRKEYVLEAKGSKAFRDVLSTAETGAGKILAYGIPLVELIQTSRL